VVYDLSIVQSTPYAVVVSIEEEPSGRRQRDVEFVCLTPNVTRLGSTGVGDQTPWKGRCEKESGAYRAVPG